MITCGREGHERPCNQRLQNSRSRRAQQKRVDVHLLPHEVALLGGEADDIVEDRIVELGALKAFDAR